MSEAAFNTKINSKLIIILMNTKKIILSALAATSALSANAVMIAGWDFSQFQTSGVNFIGGSVLVGSANANYSDFSSPAPDFANSVFGSIYYDGTNGSSDATNGLDLNPANDTVVPVSGAVTANGSVAGDGSVFGSSGSFLLLDVSGQPFREDLSLRADAGSALVFSADLSSTSFFGNDWEISFGAEAASASTISWEFSTDGSSFFSAGVTSNIGAEAAETVDFGTSLDGATQVFLRGTFAGDAITLDNVAISATTAVPEPSTYAMIMAGIAGVVVYFRRRRA